MLALQLSTKCKHTFGELFLFLQVTLCCCLMSFHLTPAGLSPHLPGCPPLTLSLWFIALCHVFKCQTRITVRAAPVHHSLLFHAWCGCWHTLDVRSSPPLQPRSFICSTSPSCPQNMASVFLICPLRPTHSERDSTEPSTLLPGNSTQQVALNPNGRSQALVSPLLHIELCSLHLRTISFI